jgi:hypothetical protein
MIRVLPLFILLPACAPSTWVLETWGEPFIEQGIPAAETTDGCSVRFDAAWVTLHSRAVVDDAHGIVAEIPGAVAVDLTVAGPTETGETALPAGTHAGVTYTIGPADDAEVPAGAAAGAAALEAEGSGVRMAGLLRCPNAEATFDWSWDFTVELHCDVAPIRAKAGETAVSQATIHADHLFGRSLVDDTGLAVQPLVDAAGADGHIERLDLAAVPVAEIGYDVGSNADITTLDDFVEAQARSIGHIDGEGHCHTH